MRKIKFKAVMQRQHDGKFYVSDGYGTDTSFLSCLFDFEDYIRDRFLDEITTAEKFINTFPDDDEYLNGWVHVQNIQYTGLKDKNGVEIYEGDIIKLIAKKGEKDFDALYIVEFNEGAFMFAEYFKGIKNGWVGRINNIEKEVIGNIYENLELLENK